jgi:hypothetical protein
LCSKANYKVDFSLNNNTQLQVNNSSKNNKEKISLIKNFLSENTEVIPIIQNSEYLQRKTRIYSFDTDSLVKFFLEVDQTQLSYVKKVFETVKNDI